jgi:transposase-like protein
LGEKRVFNKAFKERAVELARTTDRKQSEIAAELGITGNILAVRNGVSSGSGRPDKAKGEVSRRSLERATPGTRR